MFVHKSHFIVGTPKKGSIAVIQCPYTIYFDFNKKKYGGNYNKFKNDKLNEGIIVMNNDKDYSEIFMQDGKPREFPKFPIPRRYVVDYIMGDEFKEFFDFIYIEEKKDEVYFLCNLYRSDELEYNGYKLMDTSSITLKEGTVNEENKEEFQSMVEMIRKGEIEFSPSDFEQKDRSYISLEIMEYIIKSPLNISSDENWK